MSTGTDWGTDADGAGPLTPVSAERTEEISRCVFCFRARELEGTMMARELMNLRAELARIREQQPGKETP